MEELFAIVVQFFGELLLQIVFEALAEFGLHSLREPFKKSPNPWFAAVGYAFFGVISGALSLWVFPALFITSRNARLVSLILTPIGAGASMAAIGGWRRRRDQELIRLDRFAYGYLFALAMALVRFAFGH